MKKSIYIFITIVAVIAVIGLQGVWFLNTYKLMEDKLCEQVNTAFRNAIRAEMLVTEKVEGKIPDGASFMLGYEKTRSKASFNVALSDVSYHEFHHQIGIHIDSLRLDSCFREELDRCALNTHSFRIGPVRIDTFRYRYVEDFLEDSTIVQTHRTLTTQIVPTRLNFTKGLQATIDNPARNIIREMRLFLSGSVIILTIIIVCIIKQIKIIRRQDRVAKLREDFSFAMIHDMKTPLSSILMGTRILRSGKLNDKPERREKYFDILEDEEEHLLALVNKALTLSKLEEDKLKLNKQETPLRPMIEDLIEKFSAKATKPTHFLVQLDAQTAYADEEFLKEAISNLIDNAVKYSGNEVTITLSSTLSANGKTQLKVKDNGMGIPLKDQSKIFEKYERASAVQRNRKGGASGFGLGLNYVFHIAKAHGGDVHLESIEGEYSEFTINLPQLTD